MEHKTRKQLIYQCLCSLPSGLFSIFSFSIFFRKKTMAISLDGDSFNNRDWEKTGQKPKINKNFTPSYVKLHKTGELKKRGKILWNMMQSCTLCPRMCGANRLKGERGYCNASSDLEIASYNPHFGEERPLVGNYGSGTIFFSNCSLRCVFCINWDISQEGRGKKRSIEDLAEMMLYLQGNGCHNINVVTPTHYSPHILLALDIAASQGLRIPLV